MPRKKMTPGQIKSKEARAALKEYRPTVPTGRYLPDGTPITERRSWYYHRDPDPRKEKANRQRAVEECQDYLRRLRLGDVAERGADRVGSVDWYLVHRIAPLNAGGKPKTVEAIQLASDHLSRHVGNVLARDMGVAQIARVVNAVAGSASLKNKVRNLASQVNEIAAMEDPGVRLLARKWVKAAREKAPVVVVQTPRECLSVAMSIPAQYRIGALLQAVFGLRAGESSAPLWGDLTPLGTIRIERQDDGEGGASEDLKSEESRRELPLPAAMAEILRAHRESERKAGRGRPSDPINATREGTPVSEANLRRAVKAARSRLEMPDYKGRPCHVFRHSLASWLDKEGCPQGVRLALMGQSRDAVKDRYVHAGPAEMLLWVERWWAAARDAETAPRPYRGGAKVPARGDGNGRATLTTAKVETILRLKGEGATNAAVGRAVGVSPKTVLKVLAGDTWVQRASTEDVVAATTCRDDRVPAV